MAGILLLNGPNLNMLGLRQPEVYGRDTLEDVVALAGATAASLGLSLEARQSNFEGELVTWIQQARGTFDAIIINPGAYSHTSVAILDALNIFEGPVLEVHISNIHKRESFRHHSYISLRAEGVIAGCGVQGYDLAVRRVAALLQK
ncbi:type II 3-dehydroquinate dehydratase [Falsigemmobacter intermedius]|uniref:3-dehydroquinate dehydratase n=1 Tax=Falsigemmobacter intermedius TaxID=1553448 RepID=A0A3S3UDC1_9RHOB|nr:type II 3-dehydroquinate dehydratase [Falsigemmobacter intermedius]RWY39485.1 type II 3-dehydroquinate dehydratase [Falsigemmobacter intermedius]